MTFLKRLALTLAVLALLPSAARAQAVGGASISGTVKDTSGAVLPGVSVEAASPALIEKVRSVTTDASGQYKIENLRPGMYSVTFTLAGFSTIKREGIELAGTFVATINADLMVGNVSETITVTTESPIVDLQSSQRQRVFSQEVLDAIPAGRSHINEIVLLPGVNASQPGRGGLQDVGGTNNLQNTTFSIHGGRTSDTRLQLDGVRLGNVLSPGEFSNFVPDSGATQETTVDYGAISAELAFGGLRINIVPKEGGNTYRGSIFATGVNSGWQADNLTQDLKNRGLPAPNKMKLAYDINPSGGGPIMRDKLWFFASGRVQTNQNYIAGLFSNANAGDPTKWTYVANPADQGFFAITQKGIDGRVTWQASQRNKFSLYIDNQSRDLGRYARRRLAGVGRRVPVPDAVPRAGRVDVADLEQDAPRGSLREPRRGVRQPAGPVGALEHHDPGARAVHELPVSGQGRRRRRQRHDGVHRSEHQHGRDDALVRDRRARVQDRIQRHVVRQQELDHLERLQPVLPVQPRRAQPDHAIRHADAGREPGEGRDRPVRAGSLDHQSPHAQPRRAVRPVHRRLPGADARPGHVGAEPQPHVPGGDGHQRQGRHRQNR